jgi:hypothetical protein
MEAVLAVDLAGLERFTVELVRELVAADNAIDSLEEAAAALFEL